MKRYLDSVRSELVTLHNRVSYAYPKGVLREELIPRGDSLYDTFRVSYLALLIGERFSISKTLANSLITDPKEIALAYSKFKRELTDARNHFSKEGNALPIFLDLVLEKMHPTTDINGIKYFPLKVGNNSTSFSVEVTEKGQRIRFYHVKEDNFDTGNLGLDLQNGRIKEFIGDDKFERDITLDDLDFLRQSFSELEPWAYKALGFYS